MKNVSGTNVKEFLVVTVINGSVSAHSYFATKAEADDNAARVVTANKQGEAVVFSAISVTKLPTPEVVVVKVDAVDSK